jgi:hypothetical protein
LGSKLGDSLLLHYSKEDVQQENGIKLEQVTTEEQDVPMDEDDLFLYSTNKPTVTKQVRIFIQFLLTTIRLFRFQTLKRMLCSNSQLWTNF